MNISYIFAIIILIYLSIKLYINKKFGFWAYQPVFHYYNLVYWLFPCGIINKELPKTNKFCNFLNIKTNEFSEREKKEIDTITSFITENYYNNDQAKYILDSNTFSSYFIGNNGKTFISTYYDNFDLKGVMTSRPINITIDNKSFKVYYVDYLCIDKLSRKKGYAPQIIQTHEYFHCHKNKKVQISLFKREGELTGIVPLVKYNTYQFLIKSLKQKKFIDSNIKLIQINKQTINLFINFMFEIKNKFDCLILPDITNILNLVNNETFIIYGLICDLKLISCYIFRDSNMHYYEDKPKKAIDLFCSINNSTNEIFIKGFIMSIYKIYKNIYDYITIENISDSNIILDEFFNNKIQTTIISPTAYFLYNYVKKPINPNKCVIIC